MRYIFLLIFSLSSMASLHAGHHSHASRRYEKVLLKDIPLADHEKIVQKVFSITIPGYPGAYNPSIVPFEDGFLLSFRYDDEHLKKSLVGLVRLNQQFQICGAPVIADMLYEHQDVRLFWHDGKLFASGSRILSMTPPQCPIALCHIDEKTLTFTHVIDLDFHPQIIEKNWVPIEYVNVNLEKELYFIYSHNPFHVRQLSSPILGTTEQVFCTAEKKQLSWEGKWGKIRGGTPCLPVENEQLAFFHSSFSDGTRWWYVIGAATFENHPPFQMTKISPFPIMARGMYSTPYSPRFKGRTFRVAFPGGFVKIEEKGKSRFYVVYGENDSGIKVLVIDKKRLFLHLNKVT